MHDLPKTDEQGKPFGVLARAFVLSMIDCCPDPGEKKARIMTAREHGHLSDEDAEAWIVAAGLESA